MEGGGVEPGSEAEVRGGVGVVLWFEHESCEGVEGDGGGEEGEEKGEGGGGAGEDCEACCGWWGCG